MSQPLYNTPVLVIGGGVAGLSAGLMLARRGVDCLVAEREPALGGHVRGFCCKAVDFCVHCGACRLGDLLAEAEASPHMGVLTQALPTSAAPEKGGWRVGLSPQPGEPDPAQNWVNSLKEKSEINARAVILAVGHQPFDPSRKTRFGYGRVPGVMSALELEAMLAMDALVGADGSAPKRVAFIQCVGSRDESMGNLYCSRVCCAFALDMAGRVKALAPECAISFFHMDVQGYGPSWEEALPHMREAYEFVRAIPGEVVAGESGPQLVYAGPGGSRMRRDYDLVVLSVGLTPPESAGALTAMFGLANTADGFLGLDGSQAETGAPGVFVAGAARGPKGIVESIDHAAAAAALAARYLAPSEDGNA